MDKELNIINVAIKDNKYYFLNLDNKTVIKQFDISDFLIEFSEKNYEQLSLDYSKKISDKFKNITNVEDYLLYIMYLYNKKYEYQNLKLLINMLFSNPSESYDVLGKRLSEITDIKYSIVSGITLEDDLTAPLEVYSFSSYESFALFTIFKALSLNIRFNKCKNCGKYFVPTSKSNEIYCTRIYRNNKTCRDIGYENSVKADDIAKAYRNAYKTQNAKKQRNKNIEDINEMFYKWATEAKEMYELCKDDKIQLKELKKWFKEHQNWINK